MSQVIDLATGEDLDQRLSTLEVLEQEDFSARIISSSLDGITSLDSRFRYTIWNPAMEKMTGCLKEDVLGRKAFDIFPFLEQQGVDKLMKKALQGQTLRTLATPYEVPGTGKSGFCESQISPLKNEQGEIVGILCFVRDVTERKRSFDEIVRLNQNLENQVQERTSELEAAVVQLKKEAEERSRVERDLQFIADAEKLLAGSLDSAVSIDTILMLTTRHFGGWSAISLTEEHGRLRHHCRHLDASKTALATAFHEKGCNAPGASGGPLQVIGTRCAEWVPHFTEEQRSQPALRALNPRSSICVPLVARNRVLGALSLFSADRQYNSHDLRLAEDLGRQFGLALDNARLYAELLASVAPDPERRA